MASPQVENGFVRIACELQEALCRTNLSPYESRLLRAIERKTFGYGKKQDRISRRQLAELTGLDIRHLDRTLRKLAIRNIITLESAPGKTALIGVQKDYERWLTVAYRGDTSDSDTCRGGETDASAGNGTVASRGNNKRKKDIKINPDMVSSEMSSLRSRYPDQALMDQVFAAIAKTRKSGKVSDSILLAQLQAWDKHTIDQVLTGIRIYLDKGCAAEDKDEKYLLGIIRKQPKIKTVPPPNPNHFENLLGVAI